MQGGGDISWRRRKDFLIFSAFSLYQETRSGWLVGRLGIRVVIFLMRRDTRPAFHISWASHQAPFTHCGKYLADKDFI